MTLDPASGLSLMQMSHGKRSSITLYSSAKDARSAMSALRMLLNTKTMELGAATLPSSDDE